MATALDKLSQYGHSFQSKVIGGLLNNRNFLLNIANSVDLDNFENNSQKYIVGKIIDYFKEYNTVPNSDFIHNEIKKLKGHDVLQIAINSELKKIYSLYEENDKDYIIKEFSNFCVNQQVKNAIIKSADLLKDGDYETIKKLITDAVTDINGYNKGHEYRSDVEHRYRENERKAVALPWPELNDFFQGGVGAGDLMLVFGNPGGGKSWLCISIVCEALRQGKNVIIYSLEMSESYVGKRVDACLTEIPVQDLKDNRDVVERSLSEIPGRLIIKSYPPKRASLNTIEAHLDKLKITEEFEPDLVVIDYLDLLKSDSKREKKDEIDDIYYEAKGLAADKGFPIISPSQVNRSGAQDNVIEGDKAAGSYDKNMIADINISYSRKRKDKVEGTGRLHIMKNRYGDDGIVFGVDQVDLSTGAMRITGVISEDDVEAMNVKDKSFNKGNEVGDAWKSWSSK